MSIEFHKMHAHGDDFVLVDLRGGKRLIPDDVVRRLGHRNTGIGFNQLAMIEDCDDADARLSFRNPDGSPLDACGSATRGAADLLMRERGTSSVVLRTNRGVLTCERASDTRISVDMGAPLLGWRDIPLAQEADTLALPIEGGPSACSMGNPHCTFFVADVESLDVGALGPPIERHPLFPRGTNVHFVQVMDRSHIRLRIWERGGGIPLGSGSCCCGAVVAGIRRGLLDDRVEVFCDGGAFEVLWDGIGGVHLAGSVQSVFRGTFS